MLRELNALMQREAIWRRFSPHPPMAVLRYRGISEAAAEDYDIRWDRDAAQWILPITHHAGVLLGWQRKHGDQIQMQPMGVERGLFGLDRLRSHRAILVESPLDCAFLHTLGFRYAAVSSFGANVSDAQLDLICRSNVTELMLALDNDLAGLEGARSILERGVQNQLPTYVFDYALSLAKDPGEMEKSEIDAGLANAQLVPPKRQRTRDMPHPSRRGDNTLAERTRPSRRAKRQAKDR
jgi:hypothetical protein